MPVRAPNFRPAAAPVRQHEARPTAARRGYGYRWQQARAAYLREHPLCAHCEAEGRVTSATVVDHIQPHKGDYSLMWDRTNWQPLCKRHHDIKTATEDGGFGRQLSTREEKG